MSNAPLKSADAQLSKPKTAYAVAQDIFRLMPGKKRITWLMIGIGLITGLTETIGIAFLVSLISIYYEGQTIGDEGKLAWMPHYMHGLGLNFSNSVIMWALLAAIVAQILLGMLNSLIAAVVSTRTSEVIRNRLYDQLLDIAFEDIAQRDRSELMQITESESFAVAAAHSNLVSIGVNIGNLFIFGLALVGTAWQIAVIAIIAGIFHSSVMRIFKKPFSEIGRDSSRHMDDLTRMNWGVLQGRRAIRSFGVQEEKRAQHRFTSRAITNVMIRSERLSDYMSGLSQFIILAIVLGVIIGSTKLGMEFPSVMAATVLLYRLQPHVRALDGGFLALVEVETQIRRISGLLSREDKHYIPAGSKTVSGVGKEIEFKNVTYGYPRTRRNAVSNVSFKIPAGKTTAIIGPSGAGKTTMLNMLTRLAIPTAGKILVDGVDLSEIDRKVWSKVIAIAGQDVELVEGTIRENILFYRDLPEKDLDWACRVAGVTEFLDRMEDGYDEWVGEEALHLSGGQRQRIGLARALIGHPDVLILDEATSALDEDLEDKILADVFAEFRDKTVILITHRKRVTDSIENIIHLERPRAIQTWAEAV